MVTSAEQNTHQCGTRIAHALKSIYPLNTAKLISRETGLSVRTLERLLDGTVSPSFDTFVRLLGAYPSLLLALSPVVLWAPVATAAVEEALMQRALEQMPAKRRAAIAAMGDRL